mmetsp:Transcript_18920/g.28779  ORF Transcript_18920/g.28779 Transcript_18920/m.28779 type:complete len:121 (+) Transcript_18920:505-867(+)
MVQGIFCEELQTKLRQPDFYFCFLDEKWFYTISRRKKIKMLPTGPLEDPQREMQQSPKTRSRRFPSNCKSSHSRFSDNAETNRLIKTNWRECFNPNETDTKHLQTLVDPVNGSTSSTMSN